MNPYSLPAVIAFVVNFTLALMILLSDPRSERHRWFAGLIFAFSAWNIIEALVIASPSQARAHLLSNVLYRFVYLMPAFFLVFVVHIATQRRSWLRGTLPTAVILAFPALLLFVSRHNFPIRLLVIHTRPLAFYYAVDLLATPLALLLTVSAVAYLGFAFALLLRCRHRASSARQRRQLTSILVGFPAFFLLFLTSWLLSPFRHTAQLYILGTGFTVLVSISLWVAAREYGLLRIRRLLAGGLAFTIFSAIILAFYLLVLRSLSDVVASTFGIQSPILDVALVLGLALVVRPAERTLQNLLEQTFGRGIRAYRGELLKLGEDLLDYRGRHHFVRRVCRFLRANFGARACGFFLPLGNNGDFELWTSKGQTDTRIHLPPTFVRTLARLARPVEVTELEEMRVRRDFVEFLRQAEAELIVPLVAQKSLLGLVYFGRHGASTGLDEESLQMVGVLGNELSVTLARNLLIEQVEAREREQARADRVDALRRLLAGVAHEIRNPLNTIATAAETMLRRPHEEETVRDMAGIISSEAERLNNLLTDFLRLQRVRSPSPRPINLREIVDRALLGIPRSEDAPQIEIHVSDSCHSVYTDDQLLEQVLLNLVNNAVDAARLAQGEAPRVAVGAECSRDKLILSVEDNGPGIRNEIRGRIFDPFFTTKPEGTGLGLAIVQNIVSVLRGDLQVSSRPGRTVFTVSIPVEGPRGEP